MKNSALTSRAALLSTSRKHFAAFTAAGLALTGALTVGAAQAQTPGKNDSGRTGSSTTQVDLGTSSPISNDAPRSSGVTSPISSATSRSAGISKSSKSSKSSSGTQGSSNAS